ncbi:thioredoxin reductase (NADPH) [Succinivibrio dextrinosolvens]|uniref:FAD-dependent oxidoreductase n=1 Tax=Succinivibrio dextrinosolvens TaxID=83771 RepID=UPI0008F2FF30|nr:FAD-dependent oxidoreductase [Succinivibrio dextrinosolvens]SFS49437.1 thioredoxin reductase (NADPH) [Succinivibrio dextrinosolvens]
MEKMYDAIIIGGGPAGLTAAIYLARARYKVLVVEKEKIGGQITITSEVVNYPGIISTSGTELTATMYQQAQNFGAEFLSADVTDLNLNNKIKEIITSKGILKTLSVIIATGANPRRVGFDGEDKFQGRGVAYCATCDGEFFTGKDLLVIGGGFAAVEESIFLTKYARSITICVRSAEFKCARSVSDELKKYPSIKVLFNTEVVKVDGENSVESAKLINNLTHEESDFRSEDGQNFGVFVFAGYVPNTAMFKDRICLDENGYVITDENRMTSVEGVYAAGDLCVKNLRQVVTAVSDGAISATAAEKHISRVHDELNLPEFKQEKASVKTQSTLSVKDSVAESESDSFLSAEIKSQVGAVIAKFENDVILRVHDDNSELASKLKGFCEEFASLSERIHYEVVNTDSDPGIHILNQEGSADRIVFHGVPGGHEFNSFIVALYNTAGPGQTIDEALLASIKSIDKNVDIKIVVSLSCTMCPEAVMGSQRIASLNDRVKAQMYDIQYYPDLKDKYNIMSVPCIILNDSKVVFGKKNAGDFVELIKEL